MVAQYSRGGDEEERGQEALRQRNNQIGNSNVGCKERAHVRGDGYLNSRDPEQRTSNLPII